MGHPAALPALQVCPKWVHRTAPRPICALRSAAKHGNVLGSNSGRFRLKARKIANSVCEFAEEIFIQMRAQDAGIGRKVVGVIRQKRVFAVFAAVLAMTTVMWSQSPAQSAIQAQQRPNRITQEVTSGAMVTIAGMVHPLTRRATDLGAVNSEMQLDWLTPEHRAERGRADGAGCAAGGAAGSEVAAVSPLADTGGVRCALWADGRRPEQGDRVAGSPGLHGEKRSDVAQCDHFQRQGVAGGVGVPYAVAPVQAGTGKRTLRMRRRCGFRRELRACC